MVNLCKRRLNEPLEYWRLANGDYLVRDGEHMLELSATEFFDAFEAVDTGDYFKDVLRVEGKPAAHAREWTPPAPVYEPTDTPDLARALGITVIDPSRA